MIGEDTRLVINLVVWIGMPEADRTETLPLFINAVIHTLFLVPSLSPLSLSQTRRLCLYVDGILYCPFLMTIPFNVLVIF